MDGANEPIVIYKDGIPYFYDSERAKWLGFDIYQFEYSKSGTVSNSYIEYGPSGLTSSATDGYLAPYDMVCVGMAVHLGASSSAAARFMDDGVAVALISLVSATDGYDDSYNSSTFSAGSIMGCRMTGTANTSSHAVFYCRRVLA